MNNVILCGRFTRDHDIRYSQAAEPLAILTNSIAVGRKFKKGETDFINVKAFGKTAENISKFFGKGRLILIRGISRPEATKTRMGKKSIQQMSLLMILSLPVRRSRRMSKAQARRNTALLRALLQ